MLSTRDLAKFLQLGLADACNLLRVLAVIPSIAVALRWKGLGFVNGRISRLPLAPRAACDEYRISARLSHIVDIAARRGPFRTPCLARALTLQWLMRRHGLATELRLGVRKVSGQLDAHAWIELHGQPLMESADVHQRFAPFEPFARDPGR